MARTVTVLREERKGPFTVQVFDFADTWLLDTPVPENWHGLVYRVLVQEIEWQQRQIPYAISRLGAQLVREETTRCGEPPCRRACCE